MLPLSRYGMFCLATKRIIFIKFPSGWKSEYVNPYIPTQSLEEDWSVHMQNHQADSPLLCVAWCLICWFALAYKKYGHTWHRMSYLKKEMWNLLRQCQMKKYWPFSNNLSGRNHDDSWTASMVDPSLTTSVEEIMMILGQPQWKKYWSFFDNFNVRNMRSYSTTTMEIYWIFTDDPNGEILTLFLQFQSSEYL